jgi:hypothetical protein
MVSKMVPTPSRRAYGGVNLRGLSGQQIEHVRVNLPFLMNGIVQFAFGPSSPRIRGADRISEATVESEPRTENFPREKECQSIILAFAKEYDNYSIKDRNRLSRICRLRECRLHRDTVAKLLRESDPSIQKFQAPSNREKSYHKLPSFVDALHWQRGTQHDPHGHLKFMDRTPQIRWAVGWNHQSRATDRSTDL